MYNTISYERVIRFIHKKINIKKYVSSNMLTPITMYFRKTNTNNK